MLQGLVPLSTAALAVLGASHTGRGAVAGLAVLAAAVLVLLWSDARLLLVGLREVRAGGARAIALGVYPLFSMATCIAAVAGVLVLGDEPVAAIAIASVIGGSALRLLLGLTALALTLDHLPPSLSEPLREALALR